MDTQQVQLMTPNRYIPPCEAEMGFPMVHDLLSHPDLLYQLRFVPFSIWPFYVHTGSACLCPAAPSCSRAAHPPHLL